MAEKGNPVTDPQCEFCPIPQGHHLRHGEQQENPLRWRSLESNFTLWCSEDAVIERRKSSWEKWKAVHGHPWGVLLGDQRRGTWSICLPRLPVWKRQLMSSRARCDQLQHQTQRGTSRNWRKTRPMRTTQWIRYCATVQCGTRCTPCAWSRTGRSRSSVNMQTLKKDEDDPIDQEEESSGAASSTAGVFFGCCWAQLIRFCTFVSFSKNRATDRLHTKENLSKRVYTVHVRGRFFCSGVFFLHSALKWSRPAGQYGTGWRAWAGFSRPGRRGTFAWQAWHLVTSTFVWRGWRGTDGTGLALAGHLDPPSSTHHLSHTPLCHTPSVTHQIVTGHLHTPSLTHPLSHTPLCHTPFDTPLCHTPSFTHHLWHTIFHTPLCHTYTHNLWHTIFHTPSFTHHFVTHHLSHTTLPHTIFVTDHISDTIFHTQLCRTPSFTHRHRPAFTHHFVTHHLSHITLSHTIFQHTIFPTQLCHTPSFATPSFTQHLCHTPSFTYNFVTRSLSHTNTHTHTHTMFHTQLCHTVSFTINFHTQLWHTHLIRNILPNYWCGVHRSCTNNSVNLPGKLYMRFDVRNLSEVLLRLSSDAAQTSDCENRAKQENSLVENDWVVLGLATSHIGKMKQVRRWASSPISQATDECLC